MKVDSIVLHIAAFLYERKQRQDFIFSLALPHKWRKVATDYRRVGWLRVSMINGRMYDGLAQLINELLITRARRTTGC
jgi:hypothetical protein